jgi:heme/copper-type cytochrome/quinol oxidase subunit 3
MSTLDTKNKTMLPISGFFLRTPEQFVLRRRDLYFLKSTYRKLSPSALLLTQWMAQTLRAADFNHQDRKKTYLSTLKKAFDTQTNLFKTYKHPYHLVTSSPWPFIVSLSLMGVTFGGVLYMHQIALGGLTLMFGLISLLFTMFCWFRDIVREGTFEGQHTLLVQRGLKAGMILFIVSEVMFFFSFFWGFFHSSLAPAIQIGGIWPPKGIHVFNPWEIPLLNTLILLTSGASVTWAHFAVRSKLTRWLTSRSFDRSFPANDYDRTYFVAKMYQLGEPSKVSAATTEKVLVTLNFFLATSSAVVKAYHQGQTKGSSVSLAGYLPSQLVVSSVLKRSRHDMLFSLGVTIFLGFVFTVIQFFEYKHATFTISDSVYGSTFFLTTGFHGVHVIVGTLLLLVCFIRGYRYHFTRTHHIGLESAIWYWHFVDVVWLGLYISIYHWGGL